MYVLLGGFRALQIELPKLAIRRAFFIARNSCMKFILLFVPLFAGAQPSGDGYVNVRLGYCCAWKWNAHQRDCYQQMRVGPRVVNVPTDFVDTKAKPDRESLDAAMDELVQQAQFSCDGQA